MTTQAQTETQTPSFLERLEYLLLQVQIPVAHIPQNEDIPFEQLLLAIDEADTDSPQFVLKFIIMEDVLNTPNENGEYVEEVQTALMSPTRTLQVYLDVSCQCPDQKLLDIYRLVSTLSAMVPIGSLNFHEADPEHVLSYAHTIHLLEDGMPLSAIVEVIDTTAFFVNRLFPIVQNFHASASLEKSLQTAIQAINPPEGSA